VSDRLSNYCVRVYANGEAKHTYRHDEGMKTWCEYNASARFGNAQFVNGECVYKGYFKEGGEIIREIEEILKKEIADGLHNKPPEQMFEQPEFFGGINLGTRTRYADERSRYGTEYGKSDFIKIVNKYRGKE
jgi:hypothetical protein